MLAPMNEPGRRSGVLLINLGTPDSPSTRDVRRYLREFLSDPRVIDSHPIVRSLLLYLVILPTRPARSAAAYQQVWMEGGSPLLVNGRALERAVAEALGEDFVVELAMRYGNPSIADALARLRAAGVDELILFPLFPQYSAAATASALGRVFEELAAGWDVETVSSIAPFYDAPGFIDSVAAVAEPELAAFGADHVLFSYHGLPERQIRKSAPDASGCLASDDCCERAAAAAGGCYRAQCFATTRALQARLGLEADQCSVAFQSRLGRTPWIRPFTDHLLDELPKRGVKRLAVFCPSFVADCLETLEEIGIRAREQWRQAGGEELLLIPCPNAHPSWVSAVADMVRDRSSAVG
jgi:ferrochelatase